MNEIIDIKLDGIEIPEKYKRERSSDLLHDDAQLAESIKAVGMRFPITVRENGSGYILVDGYRRLSAMKKNRAGTIQARVMNIDEKKADLIRWTLNGQRENLKPLDEARLIKSLIQEEGWSKREAARALGKAVGTLDRALAALRVIPKWQRLVNTGIVTLREVQPLAAMTAMGQKHVYNLLKKRNLPFTHVTIMNANRAVDPLKHPQYFNEPKVVASRRINDKIAGPPKMKKVESVARMKIMSDHRKELLERFENEIGYAIPIIKKVMAAKDLYEVLPMRSQKSFREFAAEYMK